MKKKIQYTTVDFFKLIMAVIVVIMHSNTTHTSSFFNMFNKCIATIAVPFFFIISGYFFEKGLSNADDKKCYFFKYEKKLLLLYLFWSVVSLPFTVLTYTQMYYDKSVFYIIAVILRRYLLCGEGVFWYILAMAESAIVLYFLDKLKKRWLLIVAIVLGIMLGCMYESEILNQIHAVNRINSIFYYVFSWSNNFIMKGIPFMGIGCLLTELDNKSSSRICLVSGLLFFVSTCLNVFLFYLNYNSSFLFIFETISISAFSIHYKTTIAPQKAVLMRELSSSIYFTHTFILYYIIETFLGRELLIPIKALLTIIICVIIYLIVKLLLKKYNLKWLSTMFNIKRREVFS